MNLRKLIGRVSSNIYQTKTKKREADLLGEVFNAINMMRRQRPNSKENFSNFMDKVKDYQRKWLNNLDKILRLHDRFIHDIKNGDSELDEFYKKIDTIVADWEKVRKDEDIEHTYNNLVQKIYETCVEHTEDVRAQELLPLTIHAGYAHNNIVNVHKVYSEHFFNDYEQLLEKKSKIENALKKLKKNT